MKRSFIFLVTSFLISATTSASAQVLHVEDAYKDVALIRASGVTCEMDTRSNAITNKNSCRTITVRIEETSVIDSVQQKRTVVFSHIKPKETRFIGCSGCMNSLLGSRCMEYKLLIAYYDDTYIPGSNSITSN